MTRIVKTWIEPNAMWDGYSGPRYDIHNEVLNNYKWSFPQECKIIMKSRTQDCMISYGENAIECKIMLLDSAVHWVGASTITETEPIDVPMVMG